MTKKENMDVRSEGISLLNDAIILSTENYAQLN